MQPIWLQTLVVNDSKSCQSSFPSFCTLPSEVAVLFYSNLSRHPFQFRSAALHRNQFGLCWFAPMLYFTQRQIIDWKIEQVMGTVLVGNNFQPVPFDFHIKKRSDLPLGSGLRYMICVTLFCTLSANACNSRMSMCFLTRATCKNVQQNLIPRATAYLSLPEIYKASNLFDSRTDLVSQKW